jgi:hypothetical protein
MYGLKYTMRFKNRVQNDIYKCQIWQKGFSGSVLQLTGAPTPFTVTWQDQEILSPIKSIELTLSFLTDGSISIEDFYSDDDEEFRVDHYFESLADGTGTAKLLHSGYLIEDGVSEPVTDRKHIITLKATDNIALLKNVKWNEIDSTVLHYNSKLSLYYFVAYSLKATGLFSPDTTIDQNLPLRIYDNLFETSVGNRGANILNDPFESTVLNANTFQNTDNTWLDCYSILEKILTDLNACLLQAEGCWTVMRTPEYRLFTDGEILGTEYVSTPATNAVTLAPLVNIDRFGADAYPVKEDQNKSMQRPLKYVLNTFNYDQPASFIVQVDLQLPKGATPYNTTTSGDIRYDKYDLATYFPAWQQRHGDDSYLQTETSISQKRETDRYIVTPGHANEQCNVFFNPIDVTKDDSMNFTLQFKMLAADSNTLRFFIRFELITTDGNFYILVDPIGGGAGNPKWNGPNNTNTWDVGFGPYFEIAAGSTKTEWTTYDFNTIAAVTDQQPLLRFPADGILMIQVYGTNGTNTSNRQQTVWKDIKLDITQYINKSTQIIGQTHEDDGNSLIKATSLNDLTIDDSPRNTIAGTLFTNALTNFDHTDTTTGEATGIGSIDFTRTLFWHRTGLTESLKLGNIITQERLEMRYTARLIVEGSYRTIRYDTDKFISMLSLFRFAFFSGKSFCATGLTIDYMDCSFQGKMIEIFKDVEDDFADIYTFNYLYKTD